MHCGTLTPLILVRIQVPQPVRTSIISTCARSIDLTKSGSLIGALGGAEPLAEEFYYMGLGFPRRTVRIAVVEMERQNCVRWPRGVRISVRRIEFDRLDSISKLALQCFQTSC